jgi:hypothetical protein
MTASCLRHGKWVPTLYNILLNSGMDLGFIGTGDGSSYFKRQNVSRMTMTGAAVMVLCNRLAKGRHCG